MSIKGLSVFLRNDSVGTIVIGNLSIPSSGSVQIWDTVNYTNVAANFQEIINGIGAFNQTISDGSLVMVVNSVDQSIEQAFAQFHLLEVAFVDMPIDGFALVRMEGESAVGLTDILLANGTTPLSGNLQMDGYSIIGVGQINSVDITNHHARHQSGGADVIDGYQLSVSYTPVNYSNPLHNVLGEHLAKIDRESSATWANVSAALGKQAGYDGYVFRSNGTGGGSMVPFRPQISNVATVGQEGDDVQYTSIAAATAAAIAAGASLSNAWQVVVYPGVYIEPPFTITDGVFVLAHESTGTQPAFIVAENPNEDLITMTGGDIKGFTALGVTDPAKCVVRIATPGSVCAIETFTVEGCSNGIIVSDGAQLVSDILSVIIGAPGIGIGTWITASGAGSVVNISTLYVNVPAAILPFYSPANPIQTLLKSTNGATINVATGSVVMPDNDGTSEVFFADEGAVITALALAIMDSNYVFHIGPAGSNTFITAGGCLLTGNTKNVVIDSSTGIAFCEFTTDDRKFSLVAGAKEIGTVKYTNEELIRIIGRFFYTYLNTGKDADVGDFIFDGSSTGVCDLSTVTAGSGLSVAVTAGEGWVRREGVYDDTFTVSWPDTPSVSLTASATNYVYYDSVSSSIVAGASAPSDSGILLATVVTDGYGVRYNHQTRIIRNDIFAKLQNYLLTVAPQYLKSGLATIQGSSNRAINVGSGSYYLGIDTVTYDGYDGYDSVWSYFYGSNGSHEVKNQNQVDITQYDNNGTLTTLSDGYYRVDYLILTSDGRLSLIYGSTQYTSLALAEAGTLPTIPTFILPSNMPLAKLYILKNDGIVLIEDARPTRSSGGGSSGGVTVHSALAGLDADDHKQYLLTNGSRAMSGDINMGGHDVTNVGNVDGVDVSSHAARHNPGGLDALSTGVPVAISVGASPSAGTGSSYALNDHQHGIVAATPTNVGTANSAGSASSVARSDHVHALSFATVNSIIGTANAAISVNSQQINNLSTPTTNTDAVNKGYVDGYFYAFGTSITSNTNPANVGTAAAIGTGTSLARADHVHALTFATTNSIIGTANASISVNSQKITNLSTPSAATDAANKGYVDGYFAAQSIVAGAGLTRSVNTINVGANGDGSITVNADDIQVGILATDTQHGSRGGGTQHAVATQSTAGFMSSTDKTKLDGLSSVQLASPSNLPVDVTKATASAGTDGYAARADHKHNISTAAPSTLAIGGSNTEGTATSLARADHIHALPAAGAPVALTVGGSNVTGVATTFALSDHKHALPAFGTTSGTFAEGNDSRLSNDRTASGLRTATTVVAVSSSAEPTSGETLVASDGYNASWAYLASGIDGFIQFKQSNVFSSNANFVWDILNTALLVGPTPNVFSGTIASFAGDINTYTQLNIQNNYTGNSASGDVVITADNGDDSSYYVDLGINSSIYNDSAFGIMGANEAYLYSVSSSLAIGSGGGVVKLFTGGSLSTNLRATIDGYGIDLPSGHTYRINGVEVYVSGPASATANAVARYNGTTGKLIKDSAVTIDDSGNIYTSGATVQIGTSGPGFTTVSGTDLTVFTNALECFRWTNGGAVVQTGRTNAIQYSLKLASGQSQDAWQIQTSGGTQITGFTKDGYLKIAGTATPFPNSSLFVSRNFSNSYSQIVNQNTNAGTSASSDFIAVADTGSDTSNYVDLGINSSTYSDGYYTGQGPLDSYLQGYGGNLDIGTATSNKNIKFNTGGTLSANLRLTISSTAIVVNSLPIQGVTDPTNAQDAATKHYVDGYFGGGAYLSSATPQAVGTAGASGSALTASRSDHVHALTFATVNSILGTANASISVNSQKITNLLTPTASADAATKGYVDGYTFTVAFGSPVSVGTANASGSASTAARSDHVHALTFATANSVIGTADASISVNSQKITNLLTPTVSTDAVNKSYVDGYFANFGTGFFQNGGEAGGANRTLGNTDNYSLSFLTNNVSRMTITSPDGYVNVAGRLSSLTYIMGTGPDLSMVPVVGGQSVITTWWGLQLVGNKQSSVVNFVPANVGAAGAASVIIPCQQTAAIGLMIREVTSQTGDIIQLQNSSGTELSSFDSSGWLNIAGATTPFTQSPIFVANGTNNNYLQSVIQNTNAGNAASSDFVATADNGSDSTYYVDLGINGSTYSQAAYNIGGANDSYLYSVGGHLCIGTATAAETVKFHTGGTTTSQLRVTINDTALVMNSLPIQGVTDPTNAQDAATKHYVDGYFVNILSNVTPATVDASVGVVGTSLRAAREDHDHQVVVGSPVTISTALSDGVSNNLARADHVHSLTFSTLNSVLSTANASISVNSQKITNLLTPTASTDAVNKSYVDGYFVSVLSSTTPAAVGTAGAVGTSTRIARADHVHALTFATVNTLLGGANASISVNSQKITNLANPTASTDAVNKAYMDGYSPGGISTFQAATITTGTLNVFQNTSTWGGLIWAYKNMAISTMVVWVYQSAGSGNVQCGIYDAATNALLGTTTTAAATTTGIKSMTFSTPIALSKGSYYYLACICTANGALLCGTTNTASSFNLSPKPSMIHSNSQFPATLSPGVNSSLVWIQAWE